MSVWIHPNLEKDEEPAQQYLGLVNQRYDSAYAESPWPGAHARAACRYIPLASQRIIGRSQIRQASPHLVITLTLRLPQTFQRRLYEL